MAEHYAAPALAHFVTAKREDGTPVHFITLALEHDLFQFSYTSGPEMKARIRNG